MNGEKNHATFKPLCKSWPNVLRSLWRDPFDPMLQCDWTGNLQNGWDPARQREDKCDDVRKVRLRRRSSWERGISPSIPLMVSRREWFVLVRSSIPAYPSRWYDRWSWSNSAPCVTSPVSLDCNSWIRTPTTRWSVSSEAPYQRRKLFWSLAFESSRGENTEVSELLVSLYVQWCLRLHTDRWRLRVFWSFHQENSCKIWQ